MSILKRILGRSPSNVATPAATPPPAPVEAAPKPDHSARTREEAAQVADAIAAGDTAALVRWVLAGSSTAVRQAAAQAIVDPDPLRELIRATRGGKDKTVYRILTARRDAQQAAVRAQQARQQELDAVTAAIALHAGRSHDALYAATLTQLEARWRAVADGTTDELQGVVTQQLQRAHAVVEQHRQAVVAEKERQQAAARARVEAQAEAHRQEGLEAEARAAAASEQAQAAAAAEAEAAEARAAADHARAERRAAEAQAQGEIGSLIRLSSAALNRGDTRKAARFRAGIEQTLPHAPALPPHLARALQQLDERLNELRQWKDYVAAPKRLELIEEMEALIGVDEEPVALAEHIRALQQEWRTINKGIVAGDTTAEGERFQQAYHAAFKPCQAHFAAEAAVRREKLEARKQVLARLLAFEAGLDAAQPDYPLIAQVLREAPQEWRSHAPVDRDAARAAEADFHRALDRLRDLLNGWYERNAADKRALIVQARHLSAGEDSAAAIDGIKRLQLHWKDTGPVQHQQSQALWEEFRSACDAVYQRRQQAYAQYAATLEAAQAQAVALCEKVERECEVPVAERTAAHTQARDWQAAFEDIGDLPRAEARTLRERFQRAVARYEAGVAEQDQRDAASAETRLLEAGRLLRAYEHAVMQDAPADQRATLRAAVESHMAGAQRWPKGGLQALKQALTRADAATADSVQASERALRLLCIRAEILSSTPTPAADESMRRDYEMRLLTEGLGQARQADERDWDTMRLDWIGIGSVAPAVHDELEQRFLRCLARRPAQRAPGDEYRNHSGRDREPRRERDGGDRNARRDGRGRPEPGPRR
jgi:hypothetical protein